MTFWFPSWRSLNLSKWSLNHPQKGTKNCQVPIVYHTNQTIFSKYMIPGKTRRVDRSAQEKELGTLHSCFHFLRRDVPKNEVNRLCKWVTSCYFTGWLSQFSDIIQMYYQKNTNLQDMINVQTLPTRTLPKAFKHRFPRLGTDHEPPVTAVPSPRRSLNASPRSPGSARSASPTGASPRTLTPRPSQVWCGGGGWEVYFWRIMPANHG